MLRRVARLGTAFVAALLSVVLVSTTAPAYAKSAPNPNIHSVPPIKQGVGTVVGASPPGRLLKGVKTMASLMMTGQQMWAMFGDVDGVDSEPELSPPTDWNEGLSQSGCVTKWNFFTDVPDAVSSSADCGFLQPDAFRLANGSEVVMQLASVKTGATAYSWRIDYQGSTWNDCKDSYPGVSPAGDSQNCYVHTVVEMICPGNGSGTIYPQQRMLAAVTSADGSKPFGVGPKITGSSQCTGGKPTFGRICVGWYAATPAATNVSCTQLLDHIKGLLPTPLNPKAAGEIDPDTGEWKGDTPNGPTRARVTCSGVTRTYQLSPTVQIPTCREGATGVEVDYLSPNGPGTYGVTQGDVVGQSNGGCTSIVSCRLEVQVIVSGDWRTCGEDGPVALCGDWWSLEPSGQARCIYGGAVMPREDCRRFKDGWEPSTPVKVGPDTTVGPGISPGGDVLPNPNPDPDDVPEIVPYPPSNPDGSIPQPQPPTQPNRPELTPWEACWASQSGWSALLVGSGKCVMVWAFVPKSDVLNVEFTGLKAQFMDTAPGKYLTAVAAPIAASESGCAGPTVDFTTFGQHVNFQPLNACSGTVASVAGTVKGLLSAGVVIFGGIACLRVLGSGFGWSPGIGRGDD